MARTISKQKKKKKNSLFSSNSTEDRISQLPDSVIHHILSFLDTKYVVQTSVLSKRWTPLWTSIHTLKFSCKMFRPAKQGSADQFMRFVDNVLINRGYYDIETFQLNCRSFSGETITTHIYTWINAAVRRNVRRLYIEVVLDPNFRVPASLFTCTSLKNLEFIDSGMGQFSKLVLPTSVNLPNLKYLKLKRLLIVENLSNKFFSNCPALKELILKNCHVEDSDMNFNISCPNLLRLQIDNLHIPMESRVKNLKLYAPKLVFFTCIDHVAIEYDLGSLDHLKSADVTLSNKNLLPKNIYAQRIMNFLRMVHNVKDLKLSAWFLEGMMGNPEIMENTPIQFCNLRCLVLETFLSNDSFHALTHLLKISPNIESLSLSVINRTEPEAPQSPYVDEVTLPCILDHLKVVEITELCGSVNELKLLEMLLRNSVVLEKVIISCSDSFTMKCEKKFIETLPTFPRPFGAATTMILFKP